MPDAAFVGRLGRAGEPAFVDAAAIGPIGIKVAGKELDTAAWVQKRARHPRGREPQEAAALVEGPLEDFGDVIRLDDVRLNHGVQQLPTADSIRGQSKSSDCCKLLPVEGKPSGN